MNRIIVDIGKFGTSYLVEDIDTGDKISFEFETESLDFLLVDQGKAIVGKVVDKVKEATFRYKPVKETIIILPTRDILLSSDTPLTSSTVNRILNTTYNLNASPELIKAVGQPYKYKGKYYVPISVYDDSFDMMIDELDFLDYEKPYEGKNKFRSELFFQTPIRKLQERLRYTDGKTAIMDIGFTSARILYGEDGVAVEHKERMELSGKRMLQYISAKADKDDIPVTDVLYSITNSKFQPNDPYYKLALEYLRKNIRPLIEDAKNRGLEKLYITGGISNSIVWDEINDIPIEICIPERELGNLIPETILYRAALGITREGTILDPRNIEVLQGKLKYQEVQPELHKSTEYYNNRSVPRDTENVSRTQKTPREKIKTVEEVLEEQQYQQRLREEELAEINGELHLLKNPINKGNTLDAIVKENEKDSQVESNTIHPKDLKELERLKKNERKPSKRESKIPIVKVLAVSFVIGIFTILMTHSAGFINSRFAILIGFPDNEIKVATERVSMSMNRYISNLANNFEIEPNRVKVQKQVNTKTGKVEFLVGTPINQRQGEDFQERVVRDIQGMGEEGKWVVERQERTKKYSMLKIQGNAKAINIQKMDKELNNIPIEERITEFKVQDKIDNFNYRTGETPDELKLNLEVDDTEDLIRDATEVEQSQEDIDNNYYYGTD